MIRGLESRQMALALALVVFALVPGCAEQIPRQPAPGPHTEALFDPSATDAEGNPAPVLPTPTDLIKDPDSGLLAIPTAAGATAAQAEFDDYLRGLDGFPLTAAGEVRFSSALDAASREPGALAEAVVVLRVDPAEPTKAARVDAEQLRLGYRFDEQAKVATVTVAAKAGWARGERLVMLVLGSKLKGEGGLPIQRAPTFELVAGAAPICLLEDGQCVFNHSSLLASQVATAVRAREDSAGKSAEELDKLIAATTLEQATALERLRLAHRELLSLAEGAGLDAEDVVVAWSFSTVAMTEALFDPTAASPVLPGPANDLLLAQADDAENGCKKDHVCIPKQQGESPADAALRLGLNTLDGFSVSAPVWTTFSAPLDEKTVDADAVRVINTANPAEQVDVSISYNEQERAIVVTPNVPLREKTRYAVVLLSKPTAGSRRSTGGLADADGNRIVASPVMQLIKMVEALVDDQGRSRVSVLDDATAALLEQLRSAYELLFSALALIDAKREDVALAWVFTTQSITAPLVELRALPYRALAGTDGGKPTLLGTFDATLDGYPAGFEKESLGGWVADGRLTSVNALDPATGAFLPPDQLASAPTWQVPFYLTVPQGPRPAGGWPLAVFLHGIGGGKVRGLHLADRLAQAGFATLAFDAPFHGARTVCTDDAHCEGGSCQVSTGSCGSGGFVDKDGDGVPDASGAIGAGAAFFDTDNPFAARDNIRQTVIDAAALLRAIQLGGATGLLGGDPSAPAVDPTEVHFVGQSMGSMIGTMLLAVDSLPKRAALAVPGGPWVFGIATASEIFKPAVDAVRKARGVEAGSLAELQLLSTFQWILDRADPAPFGRYLTAEADADRLDDPVATAAAGSPQKVSPKQVIVFKGTADRTIPPAAVQRLAEIIGADTSETTYPGQGHGFVLRPSPDAAATATAQLQLVRFLASGEVCKPNVASQSCE